MLVYATGTLVGIFQALIFVLFTTPPSLFANNDGHRGQMKQKPAQKLKHYCPRRDFAQKAKSRGGTLVTRAYIKESIYS